MKTLVLCVDRDDDLGLKTGIKTPVIGRHANIRAATALALNDPEDADTNTIFAAVSIYDDLSKKEEGELEVASICGDADVGIKSDRILAGQLREVLDTVNPDNVILVSDGTEDESIYPIISSRVEVVHVKRVFVRQSQSVEGIYHMIAKSLQDEKMRKKIVVPIAIPLIIFCTSLIVLAILQLLYPSWNPGLLQGVGLALAVLVLGLYLLNHAYRITETIGNSWQNFKNAVATAKVSLAFLGIAAILTTIGIYFGYDTIMNYPVHLRIREKIIIFGEKSLVWFFFAAWTYVVGHAIDMYLKKGRVQRSFYITTISLAAIALILYALLFALKLLLFENLPVSERNSIQFWIYILVLLGSLIIIFGAVLQRILKTEAEKEARWRL